MRFKYETKEHLQCSSEYRIKGKFYLKLEKAMMKCDEYESCFGIYDIGCLHTGFSLCCNEDEWKEIRLYSQGSDRSCVHLKQKNSGKIFGVMETMSFPYKMSFHFSIPKLSKFLSYRHSYQR